MSRRLLGACVAFIALAVNLLLEFRLMNGNTRQILIPGFADFLPEWNRGVSFSLFVQDTKTGQYLLMALLAVIVVAVTIAMWRSTGRLSSAGFGLIIGGALGNLLDRVRYDGAVFDFLALHRGKMPLFVCNFADIAISVGVVLLLTESLFAKDESR